jgi:hypothetical protein
LRQQRGEVFQSGGLCWSDFGGVITQEIDQTLLAVIVVHGLAVLWIYIGN